MTDLDMSLREAMSTQRAIRRLSDKPVSDDLVKELLELAVKAPTSQNHQSWEFIVVRDPTVKAKLGRVNRAVFRLADKAVARLNDEDESYARVHRAVQHQVDHFEEIPVLVVCCMRNTRFGFPPVIASSSYGSIYPAIQNLLLAARAAGLGANLITMPLTINLLARRILGIPWRITPVAIVPLGWPEGRYGPTTRTPVAEVTSIDQFGNRAWL
jgi:nitroreductase